MVLGEIPMPRVCEIGEVGRVIYEKNAVRDYIDHLKSTCSHSLSGLKIAVDCANGSASVTAETLFSELGADVKMMFDAPDGMNINDGCGSTHMEALTSYVTENGLDLGIAFDGDADRCLCVDDTGKLIDGDFIMAICALDMKERGRLAGNTVVGTVMTNFGFAKFCEAHDIRFVSTKVGDRFVLEEMLMEGYTFGGEQSGHIIFRDFATTGDGELTAVQLLSMLNRRGCRLSALSDVMKKYPQVVLNVPVSGEGKLAFYTDHEVKEGIDALKAALGTSGRLVVRPSGTEPLIRVMAEGEDMVHITELARAAAALIESHLGGA